MEWLSVYVDVFRWSIFYWLILCLQVFEDGAAYRGRLKILCREVVKLHFWSELDPEIDYGHNSDEREQVIANNVKRLIDESLFHQGPLDDNVRSFFINDQPVDAL